MRTSLMIIIIIFFAGWGYLTLRQWLDRKKEKAQDIEIIRENEEYLGSWASKSLESLIKFRLHRDGKFTYKMVDYNRADSTTITGRYEVIGTAGGNDPVYYPRLIAIDDKNDTVFNYFLAYVTPYDSYATNRGYDKMILNPHGSYDTVAYTFFRIEEK